MYNIIQPFFKREYKTLELNGNIKQWKCIFFLQMHPTILPVHAWFFINEECTCL